MTPTPDREKLIHFFYVLLTVHSLYKLFQMKPTRCTLLLSIFISTYVRVSGNYVPIIRRAYHIYATLVFFTLYGWMSDLLVGMRLIQTSRPDRHTHTE